MSLATPSDHRPPRLAWSVWGLAAALYLIGFYQRVAPAVMTTELTRDFGLNGPARVILIRNLPIPVPVGALLTAEVASGGRIIGFAFAKESVPSHLAGTVSGVVNMGVMTGPMILQPLVGWMPDRQWGGEVVDGGWGAYRAGFSLMLAWAVLAVILLLFTRETYCRQLR